MFNLQHSTITPLSISLIWVGTLVLGSCRGGAGGRTARPDPLHERSCADYLEGTWKVDGEMPAHRPPYGMPDPTALLWANRWRFVQSGTVITWIPGEEHSERARYRAERKGLLCHVQIEEADGRRWEMMLRPVDENTWRWLE